jgi:hypothetical protein
VTLDEYLHPFSSLFEGLADVDASLVDDEAGLRMSMESARLDLPIELDVRVGENGRVVLASAPPTQQVKTTWMPVFHRIRLTVAPDARG